LRGTLATANLAFDKADARGQMTQALIVTADQLPGLGGLRLLYVPIADERPAGLTPVPIAAWIAAAKASTTGLDVLGFWQAEISRLSIGHDALTVVLDDGIMTEAARVWFILQYFGLPTAVLNGGLPELRELPAQVAPVATAPVLAPGTGAVGLTARQELRDRLADLRILDARTAAEFDGTDLKGNARGGHLPGAVHLDHRRFLDGRHLRPAVELAALMAGAGFDGTRPVVSHCNGGGRAALAALAAVAAVAAGETDVRVYYLSFADWAEDESCPLA
jgi:thiosulfate/3-mercaptopyruvate sulfurtransferase